MCVGHDHCRVLEGGQKDNILIDELETESAWIETIANAGVRSCVSENAEANGRAPRPSIQE